MSEVPAIGFSVTANLDGNRQMVLQGFFPVDMPVSEKNGLLDQLNGLIDRQKARYDVDGIELELADHQEKLAQFKEDLARVDGETDKKLVEIRVQIDEMRAHRPEAWKQAGAEIDAEILKLADERKHAWDDGLDAFNRGGRHGIYAPRGSHKATIDRIDALVDGMRSDKEKAKEQFDAAYDATIAAAEADAHKMEQERAQAKQGLGISITRFEQAIAVREAALAKARALIDGS